MANMNPPTKNQAFELDLVFRSYLTGLVIDNPTIASGDVKISGDNGALANPATLASVAPASGPIVKVPLSSGEMNYDKVTVICRDQTVPPEWVADPVTIYTA
jgi:hypothetical protein